MCPFCTDPCGNAYCPYAAAERSVKSHIQSSNHTEWETRERLLANIERLKQENGCIPPKKDDKCLD